MRQKTIIILLALFLALLLPLILILTGASLPRYYGESYYAELPEMVDRLEKAEGNKLIVLGNSDVAFGLDGALLEQLLDEKGFNYTVCPFGLYAAVGTSAMLELSQNYLEEGDIVILVAEPVSETLSTYFGANAFFKCAESDPHLFLQLNKIQQAALWGSYTAYLQERCAIHQNSSAPTVEGVYSKAAFDSRCDLTYDRPGNVMQLGFDSGELIDLAAATVSEDFSEQVYDYCKYAFEKGAKVCLSFSPMNASALVDDSQETVLEYYTMLDASFPCPIISNPNRYILESGWFYDSNFHLNSAGAEVRTVMLAEDILAYLGSYEPVDYEMPTMPEPIREEQENTENTDYFTYQDYGDGAGWLLSGLTEAGRTQTSLSIPKSYEGKPVVGLTPGALEDAGGIEIIELPASIESLPDYLFQSCHYLTRLVFSHRDRLCEVGDNTFAGADQVDIYIPSEDYAMYRDGDGCDSSPWAQYLDRIVEY